MGSRGTHRSQCVFCDGPAGNVKCMSLFLSAVGGGAVTQLCIGDSSHLMSSLQPNAPPHTPLSPKEVWGLALCLNDPTSFSFSTSTVMPRKEQLFHPMTNPRCTSVPLAWCLLCCLLCTTLTLPLVSSSCGTRKTRRRDTPSSPWHAFHLVRRQSRLLVGSANLSGPTSCWLLGSLLPVISLKLLPFPQCLGTWCTGTPLTAASASPSCGHVGWWSK